MVIAVDTEWTSLRKYIFESRETDHDLLGSIHRFFRSIRIMHHSDERMFKAAARLFGTIVGEVLEDDTFRNEKRDDTDKVDFGSWFTWWDHVGNIQSYSEWKQHAKDISYFHASGSGNSPHDQASTGI